MKYYYFLLLVGLTCSSCLKSRDSNFTAYTPILIDRESLNQSVVFKPAVSIENAGKIYYKDEYIFISESFKGIHIIDNSDKTKPINKGYLSIPASVDMAIKGNILYADNASDLLAIDLSKVASNQLPVVERIRDIFPEPAPPNGLPIPQKYQKENRPKNTVLIGWKL